jgi:hypothetical protein
MTYETKKVAKKDEITWFTILWLNLKPDSHFWIELSK